MGLRSNSRGQIDGSKVPSELNFFVKLVGNAKLAEKLAEDALDWDAKGHAQLTDTLAFWLASRYAMATRRVAETEGTEGWRLLRELCADVAELRRGDHSAQRLVLERERAAAQERDARMKWKRKIINGLETLTKYAAKHPKAQAALAELAREVRHPFDPSESE